LDEENKQIDVMPLSQALSKAQELGLDLVEIAPDALPPVAKIIDYKKFKFQEDKKEKEARKKTKQTELKEVRFTPFIGEHDLQTGLKKVREFLSEGNLVKISIVFKGRQMAHQEFGPKLLEKIMATLDGLGQIERPPRMEGRRFVSIVRGTKKSLFQNEKVSSQKPEVKETKNEQTKNEKSSEQKV